ncbi:MAG: histidine phosphotransferase family protein [Alphaproteobacteria bacterium]
MSAAENLAVEQAESHASNQPFGANFEFEAVLMDQLFSRVFHDLISPVSAVNNGVELVAEMGDEMAAEAMGLISDSARKAADRLSIFRIAYGAAGSASGLDLKEARKVVLGWFEHGRVKIDWPQSFLTFHKDLPPGTIKLVINMCLLGADVLSHGGTVELAIKDGHLVATCTGKRAWLKPEMADALELKLPVTEVNTYTCQPYFTARMAQALGRTMVYEAPSSEELILIAKLN